MITIPELIEEIKSLIIRVIDIFKSIFTVFEQ